MSDLVQRLRDWADGLDMDGSVHGLEKRGTLREAAAAIERLTAERDANFRALMAEHSSLLREGERSSRAEARLAAAEKVVALVESFHRHGGVHHELAEAAIAYRRSENLNLADLARQSLVCGMNEEPENTDSAR